MLYEKLEAPMRELVDTYVERLRDLSWSRRSDALAEAARPFGEALGEEHGEDQARLAGRGFVTAVLERLPEDEVTDPHQAVLLRLSLNPHHRAAADAYLADHPEVQALVDETLGDNGSAPN